MFLQNMLRAPVRSVLFLVVLFFSGCSHKADITAPGSWQVGMGKTPSDGKTRFDAIIVGGGLGGLASALVLSENKQNVLILEAQNTLGGFYTSFEKNGITFDAGVSDVTGCDESGAVFYLLQHAGLNKEDFFSPISKVLFFNEKIFEIGRDKQPLRDQLVQFFPQEKEALGAFFEEVDVMLDECYGPDAKRFGVPLSSRDYMAVYGVLAMPKFFWNHRTLAKWINKNFSAKLDEYFKSIQLKDFFKSLLRYVGIDPQETPAFIGIIAAVAPLAHGSYMPKNGGRPFIDALANVLKKRGVVILTNSSADEILLENGQVVGVRAANKRYHSPIVIANVHAHTVVSRLLPDVPERFLWWVASIKNMPLSSSAVVIHAVYPFNDLMKNLEKTHYVDLNEGFHVVQKKQNNLLICTTFFNAGFDAVPVGRSAYLDYKKRYLDLAVGRINRYIFTEPNAHVPIQSEVLTPRAFAQWCGAPCGACYGFASTESRILPSFKTPIKGLYLAGASAQFGGGVEAVVMTGLLCAHDILNWQG